METKDKLFWGSAILLAVAAFVLTSLFTKDTIFISADNNGKLGYTEGTHLGNLTVDNLQSLGDLIAAGDLAIGDDLTVTGDTNVTYFSYGAGIYASSTSANVGTLPVSVLTTYSSMDYTPGDLAVTLTLPATSTMTSFIPTAGDCYDFRFRNVDGTAATSTTIAAGTGIDLVENENGDVVIEGGNEAQIKFCRESDTDVTVYVDEYIAAD